MSEVKLKAVYLIIIYPFASRTSAAASPLCLLAHDLSFSHLNLFQSGSHPNHFPESALDQDHLWLQVLNPVINSLTPYYLTCHSGLLPLLDTLSHGFPPVLLATPQSHVLSN